ncbi:unnamed protein product [Closterium sp. NIES-54]
MEQITMQLDLTPSVWEEGEEAAAEAGDGEKVQEAPAGAGDNVETSGSTKEAAGSEGGEQQQGKAKVEQGDASAKVGAELHPMDYWVLDTGATWTMTPHKELLEHVLKVVGAGRAAFKDADGKPVVLHDVLFVLDLKAKPDFPPLACNARVSTSKDGARTCKGQLGNRVLWDLHESKDVYRFMWRLPAMV